MGLFLLLVAGLLTLITGYAGFLVIASVAVGIGVMIAIVRDRGGLCVYVLEADRIVLRKGAEERVVMLDTVRDISMLGLAAARDYFDHRMRQAQGEGRGRAELQALALEFLRFSPVSVGSSRWTLGVSSRLLDRISNSRYDLVLLRLTDGTLHLLAPMRAEDLVTAVERIKASRRST